MSYVWQATKTSGLESHNSCHLPLFQHYTLLLNSIPSVLQLSDTQIRKSHTATNEQQHSNSEGPYSESNTFLKFVHMEQDKFQNKCPCSICTKISSSSAYPFSQGYTSDPKQISAVPVSSNVMQKPLEDHQPLQRVHCLKAHEQRLFQPWAVVYAHREVFFLLRLL